MNSTISPAISDFASDLRSIRPSVDAALRRPSLGKRAARSLARFIILFCLGVAATLGWQSYGDALRELIASSSPQLGWLASQAAPLAQSPSDTAAATPPAVVPSPELAQLKEMAFGFALVRQKVDQLAATQQQMAGDIGRLAADQQELLHKISAPAPRPAPAPARKPVPLSSPEAR